MDWTKQAGSMAASYQGFLAPAMFEPCARILLDAAALQPDADVLDVACGTGVVSRAAAERVGAGGSVTAIDMAPPMIAEARAEGSPAGGAEIDFSEGDALSLQVDDASFDLAVCQHGLQFFPDRHAALGEMVRALRPGGTVAIACWTKLDDSPGLVALVRALRDFVGEEQASAMRVPFSVGPQELEALLARADLTEISVAVAQVPTAFVGAPHEMALRLVLANPLAPAFLELPQDQRDAFTAQVARDLVPYASDDGYTRPPMYTVIATARKPA